VGRGAATFVLSITSLMAAPARASDMACPAYPPSVRNEWQAALQQERLLKRARIPGPVSSHATETASRIAGKAEIAPQVPRNNFVDDLLFAKMEADGIQPAPLVGDAEFLRRVSLDLTGRIPAPEAIRAFLADSRPDKRDRIVDDLLASDAYVDYFTLYFGNRFQVTSRYYNYIGIPGRTLFHELLRDFLRRDRPFDDLARELIAASGDSYRVGAVNFIVRGIQQGDPVQDTWDALTNTITTQFLGVQTQCVSCHDGAHHLEPINLHLARRRRTELFGISAFLSRLKTTELAVDANNQQVRVVVADESIGTYHGVVDPMNPGPRPPRIGLYEPTYFFGGGKPVTGEWRKELARLVTRDRQFARAAVNYLWAHFFRAGIVDPPEAWDMDRIDAANPPPAPWPLQPSHPELLEELADDFIRGGYRLKPLIRRLVTSSGYQLSVRHPQGPRPELSRYFARQRPRRLLPEELYDALNAASGLEVSLPVTGGAAVSRAVQLPDPYEPQDRNVHRLLVSFGRGDWWRTPRSLETSVVRVLTLMNDGQVNQRTFGSSQGAAATRVARLAASGRPERDLVDDLFLASIGRAPSPAEVEVALGYRAGRTLETWLSDLQWALFNKVDFIFNQ